MTVEEKDEWVLSSNRKDNGGFTVSKQDIEVILRKLKQREFFPNSKWGKGFFTFSLTSVFEQVFVRDGEVASL